MLFFIFWPLPEKLLDCPKKYYFARLWGAAAPQPLSSYAYVNDKCQLSLIDPRDCIVL